MEYELNEEQKELSEMTLDWWTNQPKQTWEVSGPAGSGKTSVINRLIRRFGLEPHNVMYMAYVGKATMMLTLNGNPAKTIHSSIYDFVEFPKLDMNGKIILNNIGRPITMPGFRLKDKLPDHVKLIVLDEGGMVNDEIGTDILSFGLPVVVLGDLNQLPPVFGESMFLRKPDYILTKPMRQKENDPIIMLSQMAIHGERIKVDRYGDKCFVIYKDMINDKLLKSADIIICGTNETRQNINDYYRREILGIKKTGFPIIGDKVICRQNNWKLSIDENIFLINGLIGYIDDIHLETYNKKSIDIDFRPEFFDNRKFSRVKMDYDHLFKPLTDSSVNRMSYFNKFQFAYAVTAHLAQGSQYNKVLVYDEKRGSRDYYNKWLYTCITRAISGLIVAID